MVEEAIEVNAADHFGVEDMQAMGYTDVVDTNSLDAMADERLLEIMEVCDIMPPDPGACIPCLAFEVLENRQPKTPISEVEKRAVVEALKPVPEFKRLASTPDVGSKPSNTQPPSLLELVDQLSAVTHETPQLLLSADEMAALTVAAGRWVEDTDLLIAKGWSRSPEQLQGLEDVRAVVNKIRSASEAAYPSS